MLFRVLLGNREAWFSTFVITFFGFAFVADSLGLGRRFPRASLVIELGALALGILVFFTTAVTSDPQTLYVFGHFMLISLYVCLVFLSYEKITITVSKLAYDTLYSTFLLLVFSSLFGALHYGHITSSFGGGQLRPVQIMISDETARNGLANMGLRVTPYVNAQLVHENQQELFWRYRIKRSGCPRMQYRG